MPANVRVPAVLVGIAFLWTLGTPAALAKHRPPIVVDTDSHDGVVRTTVQSAGHKSSVTAVSNPTVTCHSILPINYKTNMPMGETRHGVFGQYWLIYCSNGYVTSQWRPLDPVLQRVTPGVLAQKAVDRLPLPTPLVHHNPNRIDGRPETVVGVQTWWWLDPRSFRTITHSVRAVGVWARVTARPVSTYWNSGSTDAPNVRCDGPGTPYDPNRPPDAQHTDCFTVYERSSADQPQAGPSPNDRYFTASVTVTWQVTWVGAGGARGALPAIQRRLTFPIAVSEVQTVND